MTSSPPTVIPARQGDIFLTRSTSLLGKLIRFFQRGKGEERSVVNHTGLVVGGNFGDPMIVEALSKVRLTSLSQGYANTGIEVWIFRHRDIDEPAAYKMQDYAFDQLYQTYGFTKLLTHFGDWLLTRLRFWSKRDVYLVRRLSGLTDYPICSWLVGYALEKAGVYVLDREAQPISPRILTPDDIWDAATFTVWDGYRWIKPDYHWELVWSGKVTK